MLDKTSRKIEVLEMIIKDIAGRRKHFDGRPFDRRTVAEYFGNQGAAIAALAKIIKSEIEDDQYRNN